MKWASAISDDPDLVSASAKLVERIGERLDPEEVDLVLVFFSLHDADAVGVLSDTLGQCFPRARTLGCSAEGTIGEDLEVERRPSLAILAARLPGVEIHPFLLGREEMRVDPDWVARLGVESGDESGLIALADPFGFPIDDFLAAFNENHPRSPLVGGFASGASAPGENRLLLCGEVHREGMVGLRLRGELRMDTVVSQGCRPVGRTFIVTRAEENVVRGLAGQPAMSVLRDMMGMLSGDDQRLMRHGIFLGRAMDEYRHSLRRGDFLIHSVIHADMEAGTMTVSGPIRAGCTVQFHVRDAESADEDLRELLRTSVGALPQAVLMFTCNGRGTRMWPEPGHDVRVVRELCGDVPAAGIFCAGELGPVGGRVFLHGFTASLGLIRERDDSVAPE